MSRDELDSLVELALWKQLDANWIDTLVALPFSAKYDPKPTSVEAGGERIEWTACIMSVGHGIRRSQLNDADILSLTLQHMISSTSRW